MHFFYIRAKRSVYDLPWVLLEMGYTVSILEEYEFDPLEKTPDACKVFEERLKNEKFDYVISYLFIPEVSNICEDMKVKYISWIYDSPLVSLFHPAVYNYHNYIFIFDHSEYEYLRNRKVDHLYYLPLGANVSRTGALNITNEDEKNYTADISFIGRLYEENTYNKIIHLLPEELGMQLKVYLMKNLCSWRMIKPWPHTSQEVTEYIDQNFLSNGKWNRWEMDNSLYYGMLILSRKLAEMDRITVLNTLAEHYKVDFYTDSDTEYHVGARLHKGVDYYTDMNKIFYLSKINLNITLPSIETGIPQRVFDIMGSGGFVLTNYQKEIEELFVIGKEIEVFHDLKELLCKTEYYLSHERERLVIAMNGYQKVRDHYSYTHRVEQMLRTIEEEKD